MKKYNKDEAFNDWLGLIKLSWTYAKLTDEERNTLENDVLRFTVNELKGNYNQRLETLEFVYYAFLKGLGYQPIGWRD